MSLTVSADNEEMQICKGLDRGRIVNPSLILCMKICFMLFTLQEKQWARLESPLHYLLLRGRALKTFVWESVYRGVSRYDDGKQKPFTASY